MSDVMKVAGYGTLLTELKTRIHTAQYAALRAVNKELIALYWDIGKLIEERQKTEGWGKAVVERLSADLRAEFGEKSGFSGRNLWYMRTFYREYKEQPILQPLAAEISWTKNTLILDRCQNSPPPRSNPAKPGSPRPLACPNPSLSCIGVPKENAGENAGSHSCDTCGQPQSHPCRGGRKNRTIIERRGTRQRQIGKTGAPALRGAAQRRPLGGAGMILFSSVDGFVGANSFAHSTRYVRMNSHLQKRRNTLKYHDVLCQQRKIG